MYTYKKICAAIRAPYSTVSGKIIIIHSEIACIQCINGHHGYHQSSPKKTRIIQRHQILINSSLTDVIKKKVNTPHQKKTAKPVSKYD